MREVMASVAVCLTQGNKQWQKQEIMSWKCREMFAEYHKEQHFHRYYVRLGEKAFYTYHFFVSCILLLLQDHCLIMHFTP